MTSYFIVFNAGSSSLKFSLFNEVNLQRKVYGYVDDILGSSTIHIRDENGLEVFSQKLEEPGYCSPISFLFDWLESNLGNINIVAAGHRFVHGGIEYTAPVIITSFVLEDLKSLIPLAPLHQPYNIAVAETLAALRPNLFQAACFDTSFHRTQDWKADFFALPRSYMEMGVIRYGFHGLSYEYISSVFPKYAKDKLSSKIIVAHLGNGASMCAMHNLQSVATTMGFTALDGLMMGTRCGNIDPGIILYLLEEKGMSKEDIIHMLYNQSGLKGVSGISSDMQVLLNTHVKEAKEAIDLFCFQAAKQLASLLPALGGLDAIVFTAGIGQNSSIIREKICDHLSWLGIELSSNKNSKNMNTISHDASKVVVYVIPTNEELIIAKSLLNLRSSS